MQRWRWLGWLGILGLLLSGCGRATASPTATATPTVTTPTPPPLPSPTPQRNQLTLCTTEPTSISPFAPSQAGADVWALVMEPAVERVQYSWEARLLTQVPTLANGDAVTRTAQVPPGARYVSVAGEVKTNDLETTRTVAQLEVTFRLRRDLRWSDGEPLTADDVLFGYHLAQEPAVRGRWRDLTERTERFEALDAYTLRWTGLPGYLTTDFPGFLFPPHPEHHYTDQRLNNVLETFVVPGTGPFAIDSWQPGTGARLLPNEHYPGEQPRLEELTVRFVDARRDDWATLMTDGPCDVLLPSPALNVDWRRWTPLLESGEVIVWANTGPDPTFLRLDFNLAPADERVTPLAEPGVREAIAHCIDRQRLVSAEPNRALVPARSFLPPEHPASVRDQLPERAYNPEIGQQLLEELGWRDEDEDGVREAYDVPNIADETPLSLTLVLAPQYTVPAANVAGDLDTCGVGVLPRPTEAGELYRADPASPLFGRTFDLALFGWWAEAPTVCGAWRSERIPTEDNDWLGENFSGYSDEDYDAACLRALTTVDAAAQYAALRETQILLAEDLPTLFLTWRPFWFVARPAVQGLRPDPSNAAALWNAEELYLAP